MSPFRKKKSGKSFPVKVCTLDAELEFNLEVCLNYLGNYLPLILQKPIISF